MTEQGGFGKIDEYIEELRKKAEASRVATEDYEHQVEFLVQERRLLEEYAQLPIAMQTTQFIMEQIARANIGATISESPSGKSDEVRIGGNITRLRSRRRLTTSREDKKTDGGRKYNIAPQVKPIMNAIFGKEEVPETLDNLFDKMYPSQDWRSKTIHVPKGIRMGHQQITYGDDLTSEDSFIRRLIRGADGVINGKMKDNNDPLFTFRGKVAATELIQLYHTIDSVGWGVYDDFMVRNRIRQA